MVLTMGVKARGKKKGGGKEHDGLKLPQKKVKKTFPNMEQLPTSRDWKKLRKFLILVELQSDIS